MACNLVHIRPENPPPVDQALYDAFDAWYVVTRSSDMHERRAEYRRKCGEFLCISKRLFHGNEDEWKHYASNFLDWNIEIINHRINAHKFYLNEIIKSIGKNDAQAARDLGIDRTSYRVMLCRSLIEWKVDSGEFVDADDPMDAAILAISAGHSAVKIARDLGVSRSTLRCRIASKLKSEFLAKTMEEKK